MRVFKFIREDDSKWYVDLPEWKGDKWELEMVAGADDLLEILGQGESEVRVLISEEPFKESMFSLEYTHDEAEGGWYILKDFDFSFEVWLCHVVKFVYGHIPKKLYCKV